MALQAPTVAAVNGEMPQPRRTGAPMHTLPALPYGEHALEPIISARTVSIHYGKHNQAYVDALNKLIIDTRFAAMSLEGIIHATAGVAAHEAVFNNAAQAWNHAFYWRSVGPAGGGSNRGIRIRLGVARPGWSDSADHDGK